MKFRKRNQEEQSDAPVAPKPVRKPRKEKPRREKPRREGGEPRSKGGRGRFVLIIGDDGGILVYMQGSTVVRRLFAPSPQPDHTASIVELMQANPRTPLYILADVIDQQYVRHSFPPVSSLSVKGLVSRRLDRDFQSDDLTGSLPLGRDKTGRKEWNYLLIALANTPLMQQWVELVSELPNELKGIYLVPVEAQQYIPTLKKKIGGEPFSWQLLVTHNKVSGFRQVVLKEGRLVFTRVTQAIDDAVPAVIAGNIEQEILNTLEYLRRLGFQDNNAIEIYVVAAQEVKEAIDLNRFTAGAAHMLTPLDVADMLGLSQAALSADRFGDVVMASAFGLAKKRALRFMTAYGEKLSKFYLARRGLIAVAILAVLGLLGMSVMNIMDSSSNNAEAERVEAQVAPLQSQIGTIQTALNGLDTDIALKSAIMATYDAYMKDAPAPGSFVRELAPLMTGSERIASIAWGVPGENTATALNQPIEIKVTIEMPTYPDIEAQSDAADAFIATLKNRMPNYEISAGGYPWMSGAQNSMEISFDAPKASNTPQGESAIQKLDLTFKPKAPGAATGAPAATMGGPMDGPGVMP